MGQLICKFKCLEGSEQVLLDDFGGELLVEECGMHGKELFVAAVFYDTFSGVVYHDGTLLGLFVGVAADIDEGFDDIVESVVVVVVDNQVAAAVVKQFNILFFLGFVLAVVVQGAVVDRLKKYSV